MEGKYVFERNCIVCHGPRGDGTGEMSAQHQPKPRSFREGMFKFRTTPAGTLPTKADLARTIRGGLNGIDMGMFTNLPDDDVRAVIEYIKSFSRRWRKAENYAPPMKLPQPPKWLDDKPQRNTRATTGKIVHWIAQNHIGISRLSGFKSDAEIAATAEREAEESVCRLRHDLDLID